MTTSDLTQVFALIMQVRERNGYSHISCTMDPADYELVQHLYKFTEQIMNVGGLNTHEALAECENTRYEHRTAGQVVEHFRRHCTASLSAKLPFRAAAPAEFGMHARQQLHIEFRESSLVLLPLCSAMPEQASSTG